MNTDDWLIAWTVRTSMVLLFLVMLFQIQLRQGEKIGVLLKCLWTTSFLFCVLHVVLAFHFVHHWSHASAYVATAGETRDQLGFAYGAGIYFNYVFLLVWAADVYWTWRAHNNLTLPMQWTIRAGRWYLLFIAFNAVVIFKSGWLRVLGSVATVILWGLALRSGHSQSRLEKANAREPLF